MGKKSKLPKSKMKVNLARQKRMAMAMIKRTKLPDNHDVLNPDVNPEFKEQHLSIYGHRLMSNRDLRAMEVAELFMEWASDDSQPNGLREGLPEDSARGINLVLDDFEDICRRHGEEQEDAFTIFAHEWKWYPPVLKTFKPVEVGRWELAVYDILYNYCLRPVEFNSLTMNQFIAWLCSNGRVPKDFCKRVEKECLSRGGIKYSEFLQLLKAYVDAEPEEKERKKRLHDFFANNKPPKLKAIGLQEFDQYKRDVIKIAQTNRDILLLWDEEFAHWLRQGFNGFPELNNQIRWRAFELAARLDESRPPSCKAVNMLFGDLLIEMEDYIYDQHDVWVRQQNIEAQRSSEKVESQQQKAETRAPEEQRVEAQAPQQETAESQVPQAKTEFEWEPQAQEPNKQIQLEDMLNEILHNEKRIHLHKARIQTNRAGGKGTSDDDRQLQVLHQRELQCLEMLKELRQEQERRTIQCERAMSQNTIPQATNDEMPTYQEIVTKEITPPRAALREIVTPQRHHPYIPDSKVSYPQSYDENGSGLPCDPDYERLQRCRMAEIRRQRLTRRTTKTR
ncbi:unnamed protein product [Aureobasidium pullulans]|nr:unnamed protein product [Aureobasidium pullulans]